jgi:signal transduction histidine kinase/DNA-binding response OmpR family regulator/ligand-binding sensor domain-containing protein
MSTPSTKLKACFLISLLWLELNTSAQKAPDYESISTAQGLSQGMVFDILQDQEGFIWAATKNGLNRYDGYSFKVFSNDPYNPNSLSSNTIVKLFEDSRGRIWVGTESAGLNVYDKKSGKFFRIAHNVSDPASLSGNAIRLMGELRDGRMLVATEGAGLNIIDLPADFLTSAAAPLITRLALPNDVQVYGLGKDKDERMWVGGLDGSVYRFDPTKNSFIKLDKGRLLNNGYFTQDGSILISNNFFLSDGKDVFPLFDTNKSAAGNILFRPKVLDMRFYRDVFFFEVSKWEPGKPVVWDVQLPLATKVINPFIIDRSGILWSGSVGYGLRKYNAASSKFKTLIPGNSIRWIIPVTPDDLYVGNFGLDWFRLRNDSVEPKVFRRTQFVTRIDNFIITKAGDYWLKISDSCYYNYIPSSGKLIAHPEINYYYKTNDKQPILEDSKDRIWFPGPGGIFTLLQQKTGSISSFSINTQPAKPIPSNAFITVLYEDKQGVFWIGTQQGFAKVVFTDNKIASPQVKWYYNNSSTRNSLNYDHVSAFLDDAAAPDKYLWICTKGGGLNRMDKTTGDFIHLTVKNGLPDDVVYGILPDDEGNIWGSTNNGIFCLLANKNNDSTAWTFRNFTKAYGLQDDEFNTGAYKKLANGNLAFGGVNGLNVFNPKEILNSAFTPNVFITNIMINNSPVTAGDKTGLLQDNIEQTKSITLNHLQDILTLEFSSLDFTASAQNKYRYQLVGIDDGWVESGVRRTATYLHLPAGKYTFKIQGSNSQGIWSDKIDELQITMLPPWWRSWWAYLFYALLLLLAIRAYFKFSVNRAKLKAQLNLEQLEAKRVKELDTVKTQLYTNITHEFRTPLTVIMGMAQQVISKPEEHFGSRMDMIVRNGQSLLNLVNEMLDLSKLETGKMQLQLTNGDIINFLRYIVESFHSLAESQHKHLHFLTEIDALHVSYDPEKIRQIVANLLSNALKFTPEKGNVYISVSKNELPGDEPVSLIIKVKDTGIGIPEDQLQHIFDRFYQLDNSHTRKAEGTGIGLALTKELVKLMEGEIMVKSPPAGANKGSEFTVTLSFTKVTATEEQPVNTTIKETYHAAIKTTVPDPHPAADGKQPMILLVEDNADVVAYTASCLPDYRLAVGNDGKEGFEIASEIIPDLIITDVMMPLVDGFELTRRLRNDERTSHIPIIMLTAKADMESKMEGLQQGADVYLAKPFHREELLMRIKKLLELRQNLQQYYLRKAGIGNNNTQAAIPAEEISIQDNIEDVFVKKVREAVEIHLTDATFTVEQLCKLVFMSHSQLHRKLDALTGCSPNKFIRIIRLNKAKELLKNPDNSIASIALDCGYNDPGYFGRVFKQEYGVTPQEWRMGGSKLQQSALKG